MKNTQIYTYTIPANGSVQILTEGTYFRILSASGKVEVDADTYGNIVCLAGQGVKDQPFKRLFLNDKSGAINTVSLVISDGSFVDDRITGEVSIIDGSLTKTISNQAFVGSALAGAVSGKYSLVQLWNQAGSNKKLVVNQFILSSDAANVFVVGYSAVVKGVFYSTPNSKLSGGANSGADINIDNILTPPAGVNEMMVLNQLAYSSQIIQIKEPLVILPGFGLVVWVANMNTQLRASFEFLEQAID